jgi:putative sterol carrier protein
MSKVQFGTDEWVKQLQSQLNTSPAYADAAKTWEGDFYFVVEPEPTSPIQAPIYLYMDLWHGVCRDAYAVSDHTARQPAFVMSAHYSKWKRVVTAKLDPIQGLMTGQLKLRGNMVMVMKHVKAAQEIIKACTRIETEFPDEAPPQAQPGLAT